MDNTNNHHHHPNGSNTNSSNTPTSISELIAILERSNQLPRNTTTQPSNQIINNTNHQNNLSSSSSSYLPSHHTSRPSNSSQTNLNHHDQLLVRPSTSRPPNHLLQNYFPSVLHHNYHNSSHQRPHNPNPLNQPNSSLSSFPTHQYQNQYNHAHPLYNSNLNMNPRRVNIPLKEVPSGVLGKRARNESLDQSVERNGLGGYVSSGASIASSSKRYKVSRRGVESNREYHEGSKRGVFENNGNVGKSKKDFFLDRQNMMEGHVKRNISNLDDSNIRLRSRSFSLPNEIVGSGVSSFSMKQKDSASILKKSIEGRDKTKVNKGINDSLLIEKKRHRIDNDWDSIIKNFLERIERFMFGMYEKKSDAWDVEIYVKVYKTITDLCMNSNYSDLYSKILYEKYCEYMNEFLKKNILNRIDLSRSSFGKQKGVAGMQIEYNWREDIIFKECVNHIEITNDRDYLVNVIVKIWNKYTNILIPYCVKLFSSLDRYFVLLKKLETIQKKGVTIFEEYIFNRFKVELLKILEEKILVDRQISVDRNTGFQKTETEIANNRTLLRNLVLICISMRKESNNYSFYEEQLVERTKSFYRHLCSDWMKKYQLTDYLLKCENILKEEYNRVRSIFVKEEFVENLFKVAQFELLCFHQHELFDNNTLVNLVHNDDNSKIQRIYYTYERVHQYIHFEDEFLFEYIHKEIKTEGIDNQYVKDNFGLSSISKIIEEYLIYLGKESIQKHQSVCYSICEDLREENRKHGEVFSKTLNYLLNNFVEEMVTLYRKFKKLILVSFKNHYILDRALSVGFKCFIDQSFYCFKDSQSSSANRQQMNIKTPQLFAHYCDRLLKKRDDKYEMEIDTVIDFFQYFSGKDYFVVEYKKLLAKRLLKFNANPEEERNVIQKFKKKYIGIISDLHKLDSMLKDKSYSDEYKTKYNKCIQETISMEILSKEHANCYKVNQTQINSILDNTQSEKCEEKDSDVHTSKMSIYRALKSNNEIRLPLEASISVLTTGTWPIMFTKIDKLFLNNEENSMIENKNPTSSDTSTNINEQLDSISKKDGYRFVPSKVFTDTENLFRVFYTSKHNNRLITWVHSKGEVQMYANYLPNRLLLDINIIQATILLLFNENERIPLKEIQKKVLVDTSGRAFKEQSQALQEPCTLIVQTLNSLTSKRFPLLIRTDMQPPNANLETNFEINQSFRCSSKKIKLISLANIQMNTTQEEHKKTQVSVNGDRIYSIECALVRIMKQAKICKYDELINKCIEQCIIFKPSTSLIKSCISKLITNEYIERDSNDNKVLKYLPY